MSLNATGNPAKEACAATADRSAYRESRSKAWSSTATSVLRGAWLRLGSLFTGGHQPHAGQAVLAKSCRRAAVTGAADRNRSLEAGRPVSCSPRLPAVSMESAPAQACCRRSPSCPADQVKAPPQYPARARARAPRPLPAVHAAGRPASPPVPHSDTAARRTITTLAAEFPPAVHDLDSSRIPGLAATSGSRRDRGTSNCS
jgi:hypothetical protein